VNLSQLDSTFKSLLNLLKSPVSVTYSDSTPAGGVEFQGSVPSGCTFWKLAQQGQVISTTARDHFNCPIGSYTHNVPLPAEREGELMDTLQLMTSIGYLKMEEVPGIFRLESTPGAITYSPLGLATTIPDVVIFTGQPASIMLLVEAANRAGVLSDLPLLARPTCMALPAALKKGMVTSGACSGNRIYNDLPSDEMYAIVPGDALEKVAAELAVIADAGVKLNQYHAIRKQQLTA
jgi:uncharacterized protein (DUF169 family)